jgi:hypothetical protein
LMGMSFCAAAAWAQTGPENLALSFMNLAHLNEAEEGHYEGWAIVDGSPVSTRTRGAQ